MSSLPPNNGSRPESQVGIRTPDQRLRVFVSSTLQELAPERAAARQYGAAEALREGMGASFFGPYRERYERFTARGRARMGEAAWEEASHEGRKLTLEEAGALGRGED